MAWRQPGARVVNSHRPSGLPREHPQPTMPSATPRKQRNTVHPSATPASAGGAVSLKSARG